MRITALSSVLIVLLSAIIISAICGSEGAEATETVPDGSVYSYDTYGSGHPDYYCKITSVSSDVQVLHVPTVLEGYDVRIISSGAFNGCPMTSVIIPVNVTTIETGAFTGCPSLTDVYFLGDRPSMDAAFGDVKMYYLPGKEGWGAPCVETETRTVNGITYAEYPDGWMAMGGIPADGMIRIESSVESEKVTSIAPYAFAGTMQPSGEVSRRTDIITVEICNGITDIRERAFYYCDLVNLNVPDGIRNIHDEAFRYADKIDSLSLPESVYYIGFECFRDCHSLPDIKIPDSTTYLGGGAFYICSSAENLIIGSGVKTIPARAFGYCTSLKTMKMDCNPDAIGQSAFYNCTSLESVHIPDSVKSIGNDAFRNCSALNTLDLSKAESIGSGAFRYCTSLKSFDLPSTVKSLGSYCFADCTDLRDIDAYGPCPELDDTVFLNDPVTIHCSKDNYDSWNDSKADAEIKDDLDKMGFDFLLIVIPIVVIAGIALLIIVRHKRP